MCYLIFSQVKYTLLNIIINIKILLKNKKITQNKYLLVLFFLDI